MAGRLYEKRYCYTVASAKDALSNRISLRDGCRFRDMVTSSVPTISSNSSAAGQSFCRSLPSKLVCFSFFRRRIFHFVIKFPQVWAHFGLEQRKTGVLRAILISKRTRPTPVGNRRILRKMQSKEGNEGRKADNHEKRPSGYNWNMLGLRDQDVQDRWRRGWRRRQGQSQKGRKEEGKR
jgi:hypothetical protein